MGRSSRTPSQNRDVSKYAISLLHKRTYSLAPIIYNLLLPYRLNAYPTMNGTALPLTTRYLALKIIAASGEILGLIVATSSVPSAYHMAFTSSPYPIIHWRFTEILTYWPAQRYVEFLTEETEGFLGCVWGPEVAKEVAVHNAKSSCGGSMVRGWRCEGEGDGE
jgi:hypothetical protein